MSSTVILGCPRHSDSVLMCFDCCGFFSFVGWVHRLSMFNLQLTPGYLGVLLPQHASYSVQRQSLAEERLFMLIFKFLSAAGPRALEPLSCLRGLQPPSLPLRYIPISHLRSKLRCWLDPQKHVPLCPCELLERQASKSESQRNATGTRRVTATKPELPNKNANVAGRL